MTNLNKEAQTLPNIVPQRFSPQLEQFQNQPSQGLRSRQSQIAQGYAVNQIDTLKRILHVAPEKRAPWISNDTLLEDIRTAETARTIMMEHITEWAGALSEEELQNALPTIWNTYVQIVVTQDRPAEEADAALEEEEVAPVQVPLPPQVDFDGMPKSEVQAPEQLSFGDLMAQLEKGKNSS